MIFGKGDGDPIPRPTDFWCLVKPNPVKFRRTKRWVHLAPIRLSSCRKPSGLYTETDVPWFPAHIRRHSPNFVADSSQPYALMLFQIIGPPNNIPPEFCCVTKVCWGPKENWVWHVLEIEWACCRKMLVCVRQNVNLLFEHAGRSYGRLAVWEKNTAKWHFVTNVGVQSCKICMTGLLLYEFTITTL